MFHRTGFRFLLNKSLISQSYKYEILAARLEGDEEIGYDDDAFVKGEEYDGTDPIPVELITGDDRFTVWEGSSEAGPSSCAKSTAKFLSSHGNDAVVDEDSQMNWLVDNVSLRPELEGMAVVYAKVQKDSDQSDYSFNHPIFVNRATGELILTNSNGSSETDENGSSDDSPADDTEATSTDTEAGDGPVDEFYATCGELSIDTEPAVLGLLEDMVSDPDNDLTEAMVDREQIVADLVE